MSEDSFVRALRDVETRQPPSDIVARLAATGKARRSPMRWAIPAVAAAAAVWIFSMTVLLRPAPSYADVIRKVQEQTRYTITNTRLLGGSNKQVQLKRYRDGKRWRYGETFGLEDRTVVLVHRPSGATFVSLDSPLEPPTEEFQPARLLWEDANPQVERDVKRNGRRVDIFREGGTSKVGDVEMPTNELVVDSETSLPVRLTEVREGVADIYDFDFTPPSAEVFRVEIPKGAVVYDLRVQRQEVADRLATNSSGAIIVDDGGGMVVLSPQVGRRDEFLESQLTVPGRAPFSGIANPQLENRLHPAQTSRTLTINGREWTVSVFTAAKLGDSEAVSGELRVGDSRQVLENVKAVRTGSALDLLVGFTH